jgi:Legume lectin domain/Protein kinase domain
MNIIAGRLAHFRTHFSFRMKATNNYSSGDGLAFFLSPYPSTLPNNSAGGYLGLFDSSSGFDQQSNKIIAIEFDTYQNWWDPSPDHIGVDINSVSSTVTTNWYSSMKDGRNGNAWISYDARAKNLSVFLTYDDNPSFYGDTNLWYEIDLKDYLPENVAIGFSASTGSSIELHEILYWEFSSTIEPKGLMFWVLLSSLVGGFILVCACLTWIILGRKKKQVRNSIEEGGREPLLVAEEDDAMDYDELSGEFERDTGPRRLHFGELAVATKYFSEANKLGQGGFGGVYRGFLKDLKLDVAIKRVSKESQQGKKEYISEVKIISQLRHRNLVQLVGWCHERGDLLLVYELMPNGSLDSHLYGKGVLLSWPVRFKIALGLASAILYLHEESDRCVLHRDIKSSNVMLDSEFNAKLGDFGLAKLVDHSGAAQTTVLAGTLGYLAPECFTTGKASKESDVYSFGVVALEIACGRRPVEPKEEKDKIRLVPWVWELYGKNTVVAAVDKRLDVGYDEREIKRLMVVGLWCTHPDYNLRPSIRQAMHVLQFHAPLPNLPPKFPVPVYLSSLGDIGLASSMVDF